MAIEILVRALNNGSALNGNYLKGYPVVAMPSGWQWGRSERPPDFVVINITDASSTADIENIMTAWRKNTTYEILHFDATTDFFRVRIFSDPTISSTNPVAQVTKKDMNTFLVEWGATQIADDNGVVFEIIALNAVKNKGLFTFNTEDDYCKYTELSYDPVTGSHVIELDYSLTKLKEKDIRITLDEANITINSFDDIAGKCVFVAMREKMIGILEAQVSQKFDSMIARTRYRFKDELVDLALISNGFTSITLNDINNQIIDVATEV